MEKKLKNADEARAMLVNLLLSGKLIDCGELSISKSTLGKRGGLRHLIYLPRNRTYLWKLLNEKKIKVRVYIELPERLYEQ